ncbi:hypothetical protein MVEG_11386 [Podila verticillata NRRL 6337]|uniref:Fatty acyl-CoA reductase n=1 Tax=Podila verticillata NRRL 6337 TaxID=1069443 RepID=A0A086TLN4_9FUNG|nr:hypothetical protein MVEG_11386 [Podila verticillata NRRL 6337]
MEFYAQNNVLLLTGATGFIGKVILEKVLRSLPQVKKVYVLIRSSTTATAQERLENDIFGSRIWETLRAQFPNQARFREEVSNKVIAVQGDIGLDRLGLSDQDLAMIQKDTAVFINSAATIDFNESLKKAILLNTEGPLRACEVMKEMPHLKAFVQISTSFVNAHLKNHFTKEQIYPHPFGMPEDVYKMVKAMSDEEIEAYEKDVVRRTYPNTYTFTKSLAEHLLQSRYQKMNLPLVIVRPSIVGGAIIEPQPGWVESMGGLTGLSVSIGLGLVQEWIAEEERTGCLIPVDIVAKCVLMAAVATAAGHPQAGSVLPIVHVGTSSHCPSTIKFVLGAALAYWRKAPASVGRASDDIRADLYTPKDFKFRYQ